MHWLWQMRNILQRGCEHPLTPVSGKVLEPISRNTEESLHPVPVTWYWNDMPLRTLLLVIWKWRMEGRQDKGEKGKWKPRLLWAWLTTLPIPHRSSLYSICRDSDKEPTAGDTPKDLPCRGFVLPISKGHGTQPSVPCAPLSDGNNTD